MSAESLALLAQHFPETARPAQQLSGASLVLMEVSHPLSEAAAVAMLEEVIEAAQAEGLLKNALLAESMAQAKAFWHMRESIPLAASEDGPHVKHDIAVPVSALNQFIGAMDAELLSAYPGIRIINFGHFGDGNLHYNLAPPPCPGDAAARRLAYQAFIDAHETDLHRRVHDRVVAMRGSISAEHGLGQLRRDEAARYKSPVERQLMQQIKTALDPKGIMNPGKML
jgi:FAD/FMN-containing dehydrogenase